VREFPTRSTASWELPYTSISAQEERDPSTPWVAPLRGPTHSAQDDRPYDPFHMYSPSFCWGIPGMGKDGNVRRTVIATLASAVLSRDHPQHRRHALEERANDHQHAPPHRDEVRRCI